jgi:predicted amidohydrolase YtcJ
MVSALDRVIPIEVVDADAYIEHLRKVAATTPKGQWIISYGYEKLSIPPYPDLTRAGLDAASTKHPIYALYNNFHWATANSTTLKTLNIDSSTRTEMAGGGVTFKDESGEPTGLLTESAVYGIDPIAATLTSPEDQAALPFEFANQMSANGLTTIADLNSGTHNGAEEVRELQAFENVSEKYDHDQLNNAIEHSALIDLADLSRIKDVNMSVGFLSPFLHLCGCRIRRDWDQHNASLRWANRGLQSTLSCLDGRQSNDIR